MIPYKSDFTIEKVLRTGPSVERTLLKIYTGDNFAEDEAKKVWGRIVDHKWYLSERLGRDVGLHVAAVDYIENFYSPEPAKAENGWLKRFGASTIATARSYFESKGRTVSV